MPRPVSFPERKAWWQQLNAGQNSRSPGPVLASALLVIVKSGLIAARLQTFFTASDYRGEPRGSEETPAGPVSKEKPHRRESILRCRAACAACSTGLLGARRLSLLLDMSWAESRKIQANQGQIDGGEEVVFNPGK